MAPETESSPCRLAVILARAAPVAVVFRRGPTKWVQMWKWFTDGDRFEPGRWFKGRIYDRRSDLSPDGSLLVYFANRINRRTLADREYTYAWTAVSEPPLFTARVLWPKGDCWHGGGLFLDADRIWLNHKPECAVPHPGHPTTGFRVEPNPEACGEDWPVWSRRMERDGWVLVQEGVFPMTEWGWRTEQPELWEKKSGDGSITLRRSTDAICYGRLGGSELKTFRLVLQDSQLPIPEATWADWDQAGRLVFARAGRLYSGRIEAGTLVERELIDLNPHSPPTVHAG